MVKHKGMGQIAADAAVDGGGPVVALLHQLLDNLQLFGGGQGGIQRNARGGSQLDHAVLREIFHTAANVVGPLVLHGGGIGVHGDEGQLVEPAGDPALLVHIAHGLAGAHSDAQNIGILKADGARKGGHVAVIHHGVGDGTEGVGNGADINILHLGVEQIFGHLQEQGGRHGTVIDENACRGYAYRVHSGHMRSGGLERGDDAFVVVVRVAVYFGKPDNLFGIDGLSVDHGGDLAVASAGVKADAAALHMAAHGLGGVLGLRQLVRQHNLKGMLEHAGHVVPVKGLLAVGAVCGGEVIVGVLIAADVDLKAAFHPEDGLYQAVYVVVVCFAHLLGAVDIGAAYRHLAVGTFYRDAHGLCGVLQESLIELVQGNEAGIQFGFVFNVQFDAEIFHCCLLESGIFVVSSLIIAWASSRVILCLIKNFKKYFY